MPACLIIGVPTYPPHRRRKFLPSRNLSAILRPEPHSLAAGACFLAVLGGLPGCSSAPKQAPTERYVSRGLDAAERSVAGPAPSSNPSGTGAGRPAATLNGEPITQGELLPLLAEASGGQILEDYVLDRLLERDCARANIVISEADIRAERDRLLETFAGIAIARDENEAMRLLNRVRAARGLGDRRFAALLRRNAMLRALVASQVSISASAIQQAQALRYGDRYRVRLIVTPTASEASQAVARLQAGESFSALAAQISTDVSGVRGGIIDPISPADPEYPSAIRSVLRELKPGEPSIPIAIEGAYAIVMLDEVVPGAPPADAAAAEAILENDVRMQQERLLMNQYARRILGEAKVAVLDRSLDWSWEHRPGARP